MKFRIWEIIVLSALVVLAIIFSLLNSFWTGFFYFTSATLILFIVFFINNRIYYLKYLKSQYDEGIDIYFAELYNNNLITKEQFYNKDEKIINGYYKDFNKTRFVTIVIILAVTIISITTALIVLNVW